MALPKLLHDDLVEISERITGRVSFCAWSDAYGQSFAELDWPKSEYDGLMIVQENGALLFIETKDFMNGDETVVVVGSS